MNIILFDLDGTLIDSKDSIVESFNYTLAFHNEEKKSSNEIISLIGYPLDLMFKKLNIKEDELEKYVSTYKNYYVSIYKEKTKLLELAFEAIKSASEFANLGIVTTKTSKSTDELLRYFKLRDFFDVIIGREDVVNPKPHPEPILKALEKINSNFKEAWMIGDTVLDMLSAKKANINAVGVMTGYGDKELLKAHAMSVHENSLSAVKFILENHN